MKIVTVIPIARATPIETLSYFSKDDFTLGDIIQVPLKSKEIFAVVIETQELAEQKTALKQSQYRLRKITNSNKIGTCPPYLLETALEASKYFLCSTGTILRILLSEQFIKHINTLDQKEANPSVASEKLILQLPFNERMSFYKTLIRESFAQKKSLFIIIPTQAYALRIAQAIEKGIEDFVVILHSDLPKTTFSRNIKTSLTHEHPLLIIGTPGFVALPRADLDTIILESESSEAYRTLDRFSLDFRIVAESFASKKKIRFILADTLLRFETLWRLDHKEVSELRPILSRTVGGNQLDVIDMRHIVGADTEKLLSPEAITLLRETEKSGASTFIFTLRKGYATSIVCRDCDNILECDECAAPLVLYGDQAEVEGGKKQRLLICNRCKKVWPKPMICPKCQSWNLQTLGIGTERIAEIIENLFPSRSFIIFDKEHIKSHAEAIKQIKKFNTIPGTILIGTELTLPYVEKVRVSVIASFDSLFSLPVYTISEKILRLVMMIDEFTRDTLLLQTRHPEEVLIQSLQKGSIAKVVREDLEDRVSLSYPPAVTIIRFQFKKLNAEIEEELKNLEIQYRVDIFPSQDRKEIITILIRLPRDLWTPKSINKNSLSDTSLEGVIKNLASVALTVHINPERII